jgi:hypothetical protein
MSTEVPSTGCGRTPGNFGMSRSSIFRMSKNGGCVETRYPRTHHFPFRPDIRTSYNSRIRMPFDGSQLPNSFHSTTKEFFQLIASPSTILPLARSAPSALCRAAVCQHPCARPTNRSEPDEKARIGIFGRFIPEKCRTNEKSPKLSCRTTSQNPPIRSH